MSNKIIKNKILFFRGLHIVFSDVLYNAKRASFLPVYTVQNSSCKHTTSQIKLITDLLEPENSTPLLASDYILRLFL